MIPILIAVLVIVFVIIFFNIIRLVPWGTYVRCLTTHVSVSVMQLVGMKLRKVPLDYLIDEYVRARSARLNIELSRLEIHYLSNGNVGNVISALISANRSNIDLSFERAAAIDLAGRDVSQAVNMCVTPKVLRAPEIQGVAKDGIELKVKANITVRANLKTMIGGAGEDTILARICEGIVSAIGSSPTHSEVLKSPDIITRHVMKSGLDAGTAFEIVSLDIADIDVGRNIGAALKNRQAIADKQVAEARAEGRRATAEALTQENKAAEQEARAKLVESEMKVPLALAESFKHGKLIVKRNKYKKAAKETATVEDRSGLGFGDDN